MDKVLLFPPSKTISAVPEPFLRRFRVRTAPANAALRGEAAGTKTGRNKMNRQGQN